MTATISSDLADNMREMWNRRRGDLNDRIAALEDAVTAAAELSLDDEARREAERIAHKLIGTVGVYGFVRASVLAREIEQLLGAGPLRPDDIVACAEHLEQLAAELDVDEPPAVVAATSDAPGRSLLVVHPAVEWRRRVATVAADAGLTVVHAGSIGEVRELLRTTPVAAAVVALTGAGDDLKAHDAAYAVLDLLDRHEPRPRIVAVCEQEQTMDRVEASRRGVARFFAGTDPAEVVEVAGTAMAVDDETSARILMVDDDPAILEHMSKLLGSERLAIDVLSDPTELWARLGERPPDLVVLDWMMPRISGEELCRALRADPRWADLPILVLTSSTDSATVAAAFAAGADDFVGKPVVGPELAMRIRNRLERSQLLRALAGKDSLTGLASRKPTHRDLDRMLRHAAAGGRPACVTLVEIDDRENLIRRHGHEVGDRAIGHLSGLLARVFRADEVLGAWETGRFVIGMSDMVRSDGVQRVAEVLETVRSQAVLTSDGQRIHMAFSAGVALYPEDGATVDDLVMRAADAVNDAKAHGGDRVLPVGWQASDDRGVIDVALVEEDDVLAEQVGSALTTRGLSHRWFADGVEAVEALIPGETGSPQVQPRVVVMGVGLPGVGGISVLRRMEQTGALRDTGVIMLTGRGAEAEVVESLALGAIDHITKPVSVPVLIERLRRHLAS